MVGMAEVEVNGTSSFQTAGEPGEDGGAGKSAAGEKEVEKHNGPETADGNSEQQTESSKASGKKKSKKKKKGKKHQLDVLPSQPLVEANFPWKTVVKAKRGRCAVATRALQAGEVVVAERALAFIPREEHQASVCHHCCTFLEDSDARATCSGCAFVVFCQACKKEALKAHWRTCQLARAIPSIAERDDCDPGLLRLIVNLAHVRKEATGAGDEATLGSSSGPKTAQGVFRDGAIWPSFQDALGLETHADYMPARWRESVRKACEDLRAAAEAALEGSNKIALIGRDSGTNPALPAGADEKGSNDEEGPLGSVESLELLAALINTNAHGMGAHGPKNTDVALGIFPFVSLLNHSCRPNCAFASQGNVMYVRVTQDVPVGAELCVAYINLYEPRAVRQESLQASKHFACSCEGCSEPIAASVDRFLEGVLCNAKGCKGVLLRHTSMHPHPPSPAAWECDLCHRIANPAVPTEPSASKGSGSCDRPWEVVVQARESLILALVPYRERKFKEARAALEKFFTDFAGKLHPLHVLLFDARTPLMNCCRTAGDAAEGIRQALAVVEALQQVVPGQILEQANFYSCLAEMYAERASSAGSPTLARRFKKQAQEMMQRVAAIQQIGLGKAGASFVGSTT